MIKKNPWMFSSVLLVIVVIILFIALSNTGTNAKILSGEKTGEKVVEFLNSQTSGGVTYVSNKDLGDIYEITVNYQNQDIPVYATKDGEYFVQGAVSLSEDELIPNEPQNNPKPNTNSKTIDVSIDDDTIKGDLNAPVTMIEFSDYECPFCGKYFKETYPKIVKDYVDTGKLKIIFRDFPLSFHQNAKKAAEAAECAGEQDKYWEMHDKLFENQNALDIDSLKKYSKDIKLDTNKFNECLDSGIMADEVEKDFQDGQNAGVTGTPGFFINGKIVTGAQPYENFKKIIDEELNK